MWVILSLGLALLSGALLHQVGAQAEASYQREVRFNDTFRLASHLLSDYQRAEIMYRQLDVINQALQAELNERPLNQSGRPRRAF